MCIGKDWAALVLSALVLTACGRADLNAELIQSVRHGDLERVSALVGQGANINARDEKHDATALMWAAHEGRIALIRFLLKNGADIDAKQALGRTALWYAAQQGQLEAARVLVEQGANVDTASDDGTTAMRVAQAKGYPHIVELLAENGARD